MSQFPKSFGCKAAALILVGLLAFQSEFLLAQSGDALADQFAAARSAYAAGEYPEARALLETLLGQLESITDRDPLKGEAHLFLGAVCEKMLDREAAVSHFCLAKTLLGENQGSEGLDLSMLQYYAESCEPPPPQPAVVTVDVYAVRLDDARNAFFAENYEAAREILEKLVTEIAPTEGRDTLKGEIYLLSGATYEKLKFKELAIKYFCLAKKILGRGKTFAGLELKKFKYYKHDCPQDAVYVKVGKKKGGIGRFLGTLVGLAVLAVGGYFLYTKVIKKKTEEDNGNIYYENEYQAWNCWFASAHSTSATLPTITPRDTWAPNPTHANGYDNETTVSITGPQINSWSIKLTVTACRGLTRRDIVYVNGAQRIDVTNSFDRTCGGNITDFCASPAGGKEYSIASGSGEVTLTLRHRIIFTLPGDASAAVIQVVNNSSVICK